MSQLLKGVFICIESKEDDEIDSLRIIHTRPMSTQKGDISDQKN